MKIELWMNGQPYNGRKIESPQLQSVWIAAPITKVTSSELTFTREGGKGRTVKEKRTIVHRFCPFCGTKISNEMSNKDELNFLDFKM